MLADRVRMGMKTNSPIPVMDVAYWNYFADNGLTSKYFVNSDNGMRMNIVVDISPHRGSAIYSKEPFKLDNFNTLLIDWEVEGNNHQRRFGVNSNQSPQYPTSPHFDSNVTPVINKSGGVGRTTDMIDISSLTGDYYIVVENIAVVGYQNIDIFNILLI